VIADELASGSRRVWQAVALPQMSFSSRPRTSPAVSSRLPFVASSGGPGGSLQPRQVRFTVMTALMTT